MGHIVDTVIDIYSTNVGKLSEIKDKMKANEHEIPCRSNLGNVHRYGKAGLNEARPIVAKCIHRNELEDVLNNTFKLKGKRLRISEQFPIEIERKRNELYPVMQKVKSVGEKVKLVRDKLYISGKLHTSVDTKPNGTENREVLLRESQQNSARNTTVNGRLSKGPVRNL
ncbi:unnamed protein product [Mytilus coruscus]|uniref:Uncharacterized protein n=1 Tax=Mytilus coruscus TaxID=42192 RepID=A0A6J7ZZH6_MYTCO|nr:unnamed protein product [Mytilus coruscus]